MEIDQNLQLKYDMTNDNYLDFIRELRLKVCDKDKLSHGRPILPLQADADPSCIDVYLQESGLDKGFVRIRRCDLRLISFQDPFGNSLNVDDYKIYDDDSRLLDFPLGFRTFARALNFLVEFCGEVNLFESTVDMGTLPIVSGGGPVFNARTCLPVLSLVLCEATKLDLLSCILDNAFKFGLEVRLSSWWLERIHDWGLFSKELLTEEIHYDTADCDIYLPYEKNDWHDRRRLVGVTCQDVARFLGVLQAVSPPPEPMEDEYAECLLGKHQVEIYSVSVYLKGGRSGGVYGNIKVHNNYGAFSIYERDSNECESIESHGTLSLQDPNDLIIVENYVEVELDLLEGGNNSKISKGKALWDGYLDEMFDSRISGLVKGNNGYAIVYYTVFYEAIIAVVEATLVSKSRHDSDDVCVCGRLCARYGGMAYVTDAHDRYYQTILFNKPVAVGKESSALPCTLEAGTCNCVNPHEAIKLSRSRVSVPTGQYLILKANLKSCDGKPIVTGSRSWLANDLGESEDIMDGHSDDSHLLRVKVKWIGTFTEKKKKMDRATALGVTNRID